jgi:high-affinity Fe2+/Pb2+ permease
LARQVRSTLPFSGHQILLTFFINPLSLANNYSWGNPDVNTAANGGYQIFNAILGWNNTATYGTVISYCLYWVSVSMYLVYLGIKERRQAVQEQLEMSKESLDQQASISTLHASENSSIKALEESRPFPSDDEKHMKI